MTVQELINHISLADLMDICAKHYTLHFDDFQAFVEKYNDLLNATPIEHRSRMEIVILDNKTGDFQVAYMQCKNKIKSILAPTELIAVMNVNVASDTNPEMSESEQLCIIILSCIWGPFDKSPEKYIATLYHSDANDD